MMSRFTQHQPTANSKQFTVSTGRAVNCVLYTVDSIDKREIA